MQTKSLAAFCVIISLLTLAGCGGREKITDFSQLAQAEFAVPTGTVADQLVASRFPEARFEYYNSVLDAALAVRSGKADAAAYDEPILRNIAGKNPGLKVLPEPITVEGIRKIKPLPDRIQPSRAADARCPFRCPAPDMTESAASSQ